MDLSNYQMETLRADADLVLYRCTSSDRSASILALAPVRPEGSVDSLRRLAHEHDLADQLDPAWAVQPMALVRHEDRDMLLLRDPGGMPLARLLGKPLQISRLLDLAVGIAGAIRQAHARDLIHKDINPANILVEDSGGIRLMGFGLATRLRSERPVLVDIKVISGALPYISPEQTGRINRSIDARTDLYSFGVTLYEMLTGRLPFVATEPIEWIHSHIARQPIPLGEHIEEVPSALEGIVLKLLAKTREERYQTAAGLEVDLQRCRQSWASDGQITPFKLAAFDRPNWVRIPESLYGRNEQIASIRAAFDRVSLHGETEFVLVSGPAGVGKSSIVEELHKVLAWKPGYFAAGKFDQFKRDIPYATIGQAFQGVIRQILSLESTELERWQRRFVEALRPNGQLMIDLIPDLVLVIGEQPPAPELLPQEAQNRFHLVFQRFLEVFARQDHPLVLFIDDVQWLDAGTIELIERLVVEPEVKNLLLICAFRDDELGAAHPFSSNLKMMRNSHRRPEEIKLGQLSPSDVDRFVADALQMDADQIRPLASHVVAKTEGNPFFIAQFLTSLVDEGLLFLNREADAWIWDTELIGAKSITENVAELVVERISHLPDNALEAVRSLACVGNGADLVALSTVAGRTVPEMAAALALSVRAGFIVHVEGSYAFAHDRIQEAAYTRIPEGERAYTHLRAARFLVSSTKPADLRERIFEVVDQFGKCASLITSAPEREQVAEMHLEAAKRAKASSAYASARRYARSGMTLLDADMWGRQYRLAFDLELHQAECELLLGERHSADERLSALSAHSQSLIDEAAVTRLSLALHTLAAPDRAVEIGLAFLRGLGIDWSAHPTEHDLENELRSMNRLIDGRPIEMLFDLPRMDDPDWLAAMDVLASLALPALMTDKNLEDLVLVRMINLSLQHGNCDASCYAYSIIHVVLGLRFGDHQTGYRFGRLGCDLVDRGGMDRFKARVYSCFSNHTAPWTDHIRDCLPRTLQAIETATAAGDLVFAAATSRAMVENLLISGEPLAEVQREAEQALALSRKVGFEFAADGAIIQLLLVRELQGVGEEDPVDATFPDRQRFEIFLEEGGASLALPLVWHLIRQAQARYIATDYAAALVAISRASGLLDATRSLFDVCEYHFYGALVRAAACDSAAPGERQQHLLALKSHHRQIVAWSKSCPDNFGTRAALISAEIARLDNRDLDAEQDYEEAIRLAKVHGFVQNEAIANELAARFYAARRLITGADAYLRNARSCYARWGAHAKVRALDLSYPQIRDSEQGTAKISGDSRVPNIDLAAVMRMSQALSGEIILDKLIERLMITVVEHAGAVRGLLILSRDGRLLIAAEAITEGQTVSVSMRDRPELEGQLPLSVLNYVIRARETVIIDDAPKADAYASDPYIAAAASHSILCLPLEKQQRLVGALYLENNLSSHLFTKDQIEILRLLASQAAVSLENADLFLDVQKAHERARRAADELRRSFDMIPALAWISSADGTFEYANKQWYDSTGIAQEAAIRGEWLFAFHADDRDKVAAKWSELLRLGSAGEVEARLRRVDGGWRTFLTRATPMRDDEGVIVRWYGTSTDIDDLKRAEEAQAALARAGRLAAMGELTVSIAHEVNQPLMGVVTNAATILRWLDDDRLNLPEARRATERVIRDGHRAGEIVNTIRSLAKKSSATRVKLKLNELILEVLPLMRNELQSRDVTAEASLAPDVGSVLGDRIGLQQVMLNLITNGIEAIDAAKNELRLLRIRSERSAPGHVSVSVSDTGIGLDRVNSERVFEAFFTTKPDGIGMGLSICRSIVEAHGGRLWVSSNEPYGSAFHFTVPVFIEESPLARTN